MRGRSSEEGEDEDLESYMSTIASVNRPDETMQFRLGLPRLEDREPVVIARYSTGDAEEAVSILSIENLRKMKRRIDQVPGAERQREDWLSAIRKLRVATPKQLADFSEINVPASTPQTSHDDNDEEVVMTNVPKDKMQVSPNEEEKNGLRTKAEEEKTGKSETKSDQNGIESNEN